MFPLRIAGDVARMEAVDELLNPHLDHELLIIRTVIWSGNDQSTSIVCGGTEALLLQNSQVKMQSEFTAEMLNIPVSAEILLLGLSRAYLL